MLVATLGLAACLAAPELRVTADFETNLEGWNQRGPAEFGIDPAEKHGGAAAARIRVAPGTALNYQQLSHDVPEIRHGDAFELRVWLRARDITESTGAYAALEFIGEGEQRVGIEHSKLGLANGARDWEELIIRGTAPKGTVKARASLILHAVGTAWFDDFSLVRTGRMEPWADLGGAPRTVTVHPDRVLCGDFAGVGFHNFHHTFTFTQQQLDEVVFKRWREINASFARLNDSNDWDDARRDEVLRHLLELKRSGTSVYFAAWGPRDVPAGPERQAYAREVADRLEWFIDRGADNIRWYCLTNELSLNRWGELIDDLPKFADYHRELHEEFARRRLPVGLLATDASPIGYWHSIEWATQHMDEITEVYGGHHYINDWALEDERFYPWWLERLTWGVGLARARGKEFILGEFGSKQDGRDIDGVRRDVCIYFDTPQEPMVGIQVGEATIGAINAGVQALGYWTFMDFPDDFQRTYINKWGLFRWSGEDMGCRAHYAAYGLLAKYFRGGGQSVAVDVDDPYLRACAVRAADGWSVAVVNRYPGEVPLRLALPGADGSAFRVYRFDPAAPRIDPFGDLPGPDATLTAAGGGLTDRVGPSTLTIYTSAFEGLPPAPPTRVTAADGLVSWQASASPDTVYYRVYRRIADDRARIGSTIALSLRDPAPRPGALYEVIAVDGHGNGSSPARAE